MIAIILLSVVAIFFVVFTIICKGIIKKLESPEIEWYDQKELPTEIRIDRDISKDVLVYNFETKTIHIGYYSFGNDMWVMDSKISRDKFLWAYID